MSTIITLDDDFGERLVELGSKLDRFVVPVFLADQSKRPEIVGTGFFLRHKNNLYFVTASHVIDIALSRRSAINIAVTDKIVGLPKPVAIKHTVLKSTKTADKTPRDIAAISVPETYTYYEACSTICVDSQETMYRRAFDKIDIPVLQGFPVLRNETLKRLNRTNRTYSAALWTYSFRFYPGCNFKEFHKSPDSHYALVWPEEAMSHILMTEESPPSAMLPNAVGVSCSTSGSSRSKFYPQIKKQKPVHQIKKQKPVHPRGCSGGPYWFVPDKFKLDNFYLAGVFIEYYAKSSVAFVTKIEQVIALIEHKDA
jgi:hypothetical protein